MLLQASGDFAPHGTLIFGISTARGFVLCADKRVGRSSGGHSDTDVKIFPLGTNAAFMNNGTGTIISATGQVMFDAETVVKNHFAGKAVSEAALRDPDGVGNALAVTFQGYLKQRVFTAWPPTPADESLFQVPIFYFNERRRMEGVLLQFKYEKRMPPVISVDGLRWGPDEWQWATSQVFGDVAVMREIQDGKDGRFDDIRRHRIYRMLSSEKKTPASRLSVKDAEAYARLMIRVTNERGHMVPGNRGGVSATSDCALLTSDGKLTFLKNQ